MDQEAPLDALASYFKNDILNPFKIENILTENISNNQIRPAEPSPKSKRATKKEEKKKESDEKKEKKTRRSTAEMTELRYKLKFFKVVTCLESNFLENNCKKEFQLNAEFTNQIQLLIFGVLLEIQEHGHLEVLEQKFSKHQ